jgi:uncharacterized membrane protein YgcG
VTFVLAAIITLAPTEAELLEDAALLERIARMSGSSGGHSRSSGGRSGSSGGRSADPAGVFRRPDVL